MPRRNLLIGMLGIATLALGAIAVTGSGSTALAGGPAIERFDKPVNKKKRDKDSRVRKARKSVEKVSQLAALMPPEALAYLELREPGERVAELLDQLGLMADTNDGVKIGERRIAISPVLVKELLGIKGIAVAVTGFDPRSEKPSGVAVIDPGNVEIIRGLIETALPTGGEALEPIGGYATYSVEDEVYVTLTSDLIIVGTERSQIEGVIRRLTGKEKSSLATSDALAGSAEIAPDTLLFLMVNAKSLMPMVKGMIGASGADQHELQAIDTLVDLESIQSVTAQIGIGKDGLNLDVALQLDEGHHNLVYNFLRTPAIDSETLKRIPAGVAAFVAGALNESGSRYSSGSTKQASGKPIVTALDIGREVFANVTSFALFVLPPGESSNGGLPIPDVAAVIGVNDPAKSRALWTQILGLASMFAGMDSGQMLGMEGEATKIEGIEVLSYALPHGIALYFAETKNTIMISPSKRAIRASIKAASGGKSITDDRAFAGALKRIGTDTTKAIVVHAGRASKIARQYMGAEELAEAEPIMDALSKTTVSIIQQHSDNVFRVSLNVTGIPHIGDLVAAKLTEEAREHSESKRLQHTMRTKDWDAALAIVDEKLAGRADDLGALRTKFKILATGSKDSDAANDCGDAILAATVDNANALNSFAWSLLTNDSYGNEYDTLALKCSQRSNELTDFGNWMYLDTLALAKFQTGDAEAAVELEKKAIAKCDKKRVEELETALARFEAGLVENPVMTAADKK